MEHGDNDSAKALSVTTTGEQQKRNKNVFAAIKIQVALHNGIYVAEGEAKPFVAVAGEILKI